MILTFDLDFRLLTSLLRLKSHPSIASDDDDTITDNDELKENVLGVSHKLTFERDFYIISFRKFFA